MQLRKLQHNISKLHLSINKQQQKNHTIQQKTTRQQSSTISLQNDESQIARSLVLSAVTKNNSNNNNHKYNSHLQRIIRTALPMWAASTWQQRRSLLQRLERFLLQHKELQSAPMGMQIAAFITASTTTRPSTKLSYGKQLRALAKKTGTTSTPVLDLVLSGLSVTASSAEIHQATPATKQQIITLMKSLKERQSTSHTRLALALFLAWKTASRWSDIVATPLPADRELFCVTTAMIHYAKAVAHAASGDVAAAEEEARHFDAAFAKVPPSRYVFNNTCLDILAVAAEMMRGEIEYRKGHFDTAFAYLRRSVELDDNLPYDEPWAWMQPTRHALGALLLEQGRVEEAEVVYRADLGLDGTLARACQHPENVWSLHGFHECLMRLAKYPEASIIKQRLDIAVAWADVPIKSSCFCRMRAAA